MAQSANWDALAREMDAWSTQDLRPTLWWRDDDAVMVTPALKALQQAARVPLALAIIPMQLDQPLTEDFAGYLAAWPTVRLLQHGVGHLNHAPAGAKKSEFPDARPLDEAKFALRMGFAMMARMFGAAFLPVLTPPWNRIGPAMVRELAGLGFRGLSRFDEIPYRSPVSATPGITEINTAVDVIDWRGSRGFVGEEAALGRLVAHLAARRSGVVNAADPTGILTHHLVHDTATWRFLENLQDWLARRGGLDLFQDPRQMWALSA
ncbi:polysaccharide deacetylase family protein [Dongia sp.]|uniref:polysaccharide deacetylase family protein n=1 Tax=Dongia sp. TaxID=1977262 RepID=UPI0035B078E7